MQEKYTHNETKAILILKKNYGSIASFYIEKPIKLYVSLIVDTTICKWENVCNPNVNP
jgi:hypothetical protein